MESDPYGEKPKEAVAIKLHGFHLSTHNVHYNNNRPFVIVNSERT